MKDIHFSAWQGILGDAAEVEPGQIAHFIVAINVVEPDVGQKFFFATCCDSGRWPTHMLEHLVQALAERN